MDERLELMGCVIRGFVNTQNQAKAMRLSRHDVTFRGACPGLNHLTVELEVYDEVDVLRIGTGASIERVRETAHHVTGWSGKKVMMEVRDCNVLIRLVESMTLNDW